MTEWSWNGARWWKFDFHTHTPASDDYGKGPDHQELRERSPEAWLLDYMRAGVDCVAITDHNTGGWTDRLKDALEGLATSGHSGYRKLYLFPGMEISVEGGIHLLAIFDPSKTSSDLDALRGAVAYQGTPGQSDGVTRKSLIEVVDAIVSADGIAIPAHVDEKNGLFQKHSGVSLQQILACSNIFAMELRTSGSQKPSIYLNSKANWTEVTGSDSHHPNGNANQSYPGSHYTWVKMGSPSIDGLRLALIDGELSVQRSGTKCDPNKHASSAIESVDICQARYVGRAQSFLQSFNPFLNAIIGGRGTGKSTVVEFLRIVMRRQGELPEELRQEFEKYNHVYPQREDSGLLTEDAVISTIYRKNGNRFRIRWCVAGDIEPIEQEIDGEWRPAEGDIQQRFPVRIYSQKQVFQLAKTPLALLKVVDEASEVDRHTWSEKWKVEESRFLSLRAQIREIETGFVEEPRLRGELDDVTQKLALFETAGHAEILKSFQEQKRQEQRVDAWEESWIDTGSRLRDVATGIVPTRLDETSFETESASDKELKDYAIRVRDHLDDIRKRIETLASQADDIVVEWRKNRDDSWQHTVDCATRAYEGLCEKLAQEGAGDPTAYGRFVEHRRDIERQLRELAERREKVRELKNQTGECLGNLLEIRRDLTIARRTFLDEVLRNNQHVQISVIPYGARETAESEFRHLLQKEDGHFERDIGVPGGEGLLGEIYHGAEEAGDVERNLSCVKEKIKNMASNQHEAPPVADRRFVTHVSRLHPEAMDRLDLWFPEDSLEVEYSTTGDGQGFRPIREGSPGQKTAALLAFLLSYGEDPLILDQPEDDLDNHLIYGLIVTQLREVKSRRQVIVITHNANLVVNGDAELVVALAPRGGETAKECEGSLQDKSVRNTICEILEGGRKAFDDRYRRIALE